MIRQLAAALVLLCAGACGTPQAVRTVFIGDYEFTPEERRVIARIADDAAAEARRVLPGLAPQITIRAQSGPG